MSYCERAHRGPGIGTVSAEAGLVLYATHLGLANSSEQAHGEMDDEAAEEYEAHATVALENDVAAPGKWAGKVLGSMCGNVILSDRTASHQAKLVLTRTVQRESPS